MQGRTIPSGTFFCFWHTSALFLEEFSCMRILREFSRVARRTCRKFLEISSLPSSLTHTCPACLSILFHTGDIQVLGNCTQLKSVNFSDCHHIKGGCCFKLRGTFFLQVAVQSALVPRIFLGGILRMFSRVADICTTNKRK